MPKVSPETLDAFAQDFEDHPQAVLRWRNKAMLRANAQGRPRGVISQAVRSPIEAITFIPVTAESTKKAFELDLVRAVTLCVHGTEEERQIVLSGLGFGEKGMEPQNLAVVTEEPFVSEVMGKAVEAVVAPFLKTEPVAIDQQIAQLLMPVVLAN